MLRDRFDNSTRSLSTMTTRSKPSSARFLRISLPRAPAPMTATFVARIRSWSHHSSRRNRLKRSSATSPEDTRSGRSGMLLAWKQGAGGYLRLEAKNVALLHAGSGQSLRILDLPAGIFVVELIAEKGSVRPRFGQAELVDQYCNDLVRGGIVRHFHRNALILCGVVNGHVDGWHRCLSHPPGIILLKERIERGPSAFSKIPAARGE